MSKNLVMVDFAGKDTRSVSAMLRGNGDGREKRFLDFMSREALREPLLSEEELVEVFKIQSNAELHRDLRKIQSGVKKTWLRDGKLTSLFRNLRFS